MSERTKLVCNLGTREMFRHPMAEGTWRSTCKSVKLDGKKWYECRQQDGGGISHLLGTERVRLIEVGKNENE